MNDATGSEIANLLLGYPRAGSVSLTTPVESYINCYAGYLQDDIRVTPSLTVNLGLRLEYETGLRERNNNFTVDFDQSVVSPISNDLLAVNGGLIFAGQNGAPTEQGDTGLRLGPRFGLAWKVGSKTVIRGGMGLFWAPLRVEQSAEGVGAIGFTQSTPYVGSNDGGLTPSRSLSNPYPEGFLQPTGSASGLLTGVGSTIGYANPTRRGGLVTQYSIDIQRELPGEVNVTLAYIGSRSSRLTYGSVGAGYSNINALSPEFFSEGNALLGAVANPFFGAGGATVARNQLLRPFPQFNQVREYYGDTAESRYDSVVIRAQKRLSHGLSFLSSITWSRAFTDVYGNSNSLMEIGYLFPQNSYDLGAEYGPDTSIAPLRFVASFSYDLPFGRGKQYLNSNRWLTYRWAVSVSRAP